MRLDFDVDGPANSVAELNTRSLPAGANNAYGNAFVMEPTVLTTELQARRDLGHGGDRMWRVFNPAVIGERGYTAGYTLMPGESTQPYLAPTSPARRRAGFADHALWVTRYRPGETDAAGRYPNQARGGDGLPRFAAADASVVNTDVVVWYTFGITHIPRVEDWPVMPVHRAGFTLVPDGFFSRNPALDVPLPAHLAQARVTLEGTWTAVSAERNGAPDPGVTGHQLTVAGNTFVIKRGGQTLYAGTVTTDPSRTPAHIDFHHTEGQAKGTTWRGVYALQGDTLTIADNAADTRKPRPTALAAPADSGHVVVVFTRGAR
jgi:uncharacterized protein (TIGR03067 family)